MSSGGTWTEPELLAAFGLYCRTPFGRLHAKNPELIAAASVMGRTPGALAMKLVNFAALDPVQEARGISGLGNVSKADVEVWEAFRRSPADVALAAQEAMARLGIADEEAATEPQIPVGPTERDAVVRVRLLQQFFRRTVLASYDSRCAICEIPVRSLLCASHIVPWSVEEGRRADPTNGVALCALHDRAFDRGLIAMEDDLRLVVSSSLKAVPQPPDLMQLALLGIDGRFARPPSRFHPAAESLAYHREHVFVS